ncbi:MULTISPECIES: membrane protein insertion efficiency factor YidD [Deinococcus]|uniref:Membrane protein insertion efficiency factor YidD n=1 Tax=Deinococcus rufus TaxID=2136097 RepID=A0ABV7ZAB5_9DEIO|nr:membrane protein insertion efficiency factor YidD [Deinococcus sp. AB2017081]WQE97340.1 membrane protein insertion efficiency factor YidD [Deinococcus sp. AB2017081]
MTFQTAALVTSIDLYRRWLSPLKGFRCAHAAFYGGGSCSAAVQELIAQHGVVASRHAVAARFLACRQAYGHLAAAPGVTGGPSVRGVCCCGPLPIPFRCG